MHLQDGKIELFDAAGKVLQTLELGSSLEGEMALTQLPAGLYFYRWSSGNMVSQMKKLLVQ